MSDERWASVEHRPGEGVVVHVDGRTLMSVAPGQHDKLVARALKEMLSGPILIGIDWTDVRDALAPGLTSAIEARAIVQAGTAANLARTWPVWREQLGGRGFLLIQLAGDDEEDSLSGIDQVQTLWEAEFGDALCALTVVDGNGPSWSVVLSANDEARAA